jgi:integration host factor subunit beta
MIRSGLVRRLSDRRKIGGAEADLIVAAIFGTIVSALERNESVGIRGLGTFSVRRYRGYGGRNPKTGESIEIRAKRLPHFKPGAELRARINLRTSEDVHRPALHPRRERRASRPALLRVQAVQTAHPASRPR